MRTDISRIHEKSKYTEITPGNHVYGGGTSKAFNTGEWRTATPVIDESKCVHCLLCAPLTGEGKSTYDVALSSAANVLTSI